MFTRGNKNVSGQKELRHLACDLGRARAAKCLLEAVATTGETMCLLRSENGFFEFCCFFLRFSMFFFFFSKVFQGRFSILFSP